MPRLFLGSMEIRGVKLGELPHRLACGLTPMPCRLPLQGGVIYGDRLGFFVFIAFICGY